MKKALILLLCLLTFQVLPAHARLLTAFECELQTPRNGGISLLIVPNRVVTGSFTNSENALESFAAIYAQNQNYFDKDKDIMVVRDAARNTWDVFRFTSGELLLQRATCR